MNLEILQKMARDEPHRYRREIGDILETAIKEENFLIIKYLLTDNAIKSDTSYLALVVDTGNCEIYEYCSSVYSVSNNIKKDFFRQAFQKGRYPLCLSIAKGIDSFTCNMSILCDVVDDNQTDLANEIILNIEKIEGNLSNLVEIAYHMCSSNVAIFLLNHPALKMKDENKFIYALRMNAYNIVTEMIMSDKVSDREVHNIMNNIENHDAHEKRQTLEGILKTKHEKKLMDALLSQSIKPHTNKL